MKSKKTTIRLYVGAFTFNYVTLKAEAGKTIAENLGVKSPETKLGNSVMFAGTKKVDEHYVVQEGDTVIVRVMPEASAMAAVAIVSQVISIATVVVVAGAAILYAVCPSFRNWLLGLFAPDTDENDNSVKETPTVSGTQNQSARDKPVPLVLGKSLLTPYVVGKGYTLPYGAYGTKRTYQVLYMLGYAPLSVKNIKLKYAALATNNADVRNGYITIDGTSFNSIRDTLALEIRQGANEVNLYPQKVIQDDVNTQIQKVEGYAATPVLRYSAFNPMKIQMEVVFQGLYELDDDGDRDRRRVTVQAQYSFDNVNWLNFGFTGGGTYEYWVTESYTDYDKYGHEQKKYRDVKRIGYEVSYDPYTGYTSFYMARNEVMYFVAEKAFTFEELDGMINGDDENFVYMRIQRINDDSTKSTVCDKVYLSATRTWCFDKKKSKEAGYLVPQSPVEEALRDMTVRMAMRIEATESLKGSIEALNCEEQSLCKTWDSENEQWSDEVSATSNPASLVYSLFTHPMLKTNAYDTGKIDLAKLGELYEFCEASKYECNAILTSQMKLGDVIRKVLECGHSFPILVDNQHSFFIDKAQTTPVAVLNNHNILSDNLSNSKEFAELPDGLEISFTNKNANYQKDTIRCMYDSSKANDPDAKLEKVSYDFITDPALAWRMGKYNLAKRKLRPETWVRKLSVDGELINVGDLVELQDDTIAVGIGDGGIIRSLKKSDNGLFITGIVCDAEIDFMDETETYGVKIVHADGEHDPSIKTYQLVVTEEGRTTEFTFDDPIAVSAVDAPAVGDLCAFGIFTKITTMAVCLSKQMNEDNTFNMTLTPYNDAIYGYDDPDHMVDQLPEFESNVTINRSESTPYELPDDYLTKDDVANVVADVTKEGSAVVGHPDTPQLLSITATRDSIDLKWHQNSFGSKNDILAFVVELSKDGGYNFEVAGSTKEQGYSYPLTGQYLEAEDFADWRFRVYAVNIYAEEISQLDPHASEYTEWWSVYTSGYGTWQLNAPAVNVNTSSRNVNLKLSQPPRADGKELYGNTRYRVEVMRPDIDDTYYKPATGLNPYAAEDNYKDGSGYVISDGTYVQVMPLKGQDTELIENTLYMFRITAENEAGTSQSTEVNTVAECDSIRDIVKAKETAKEAYISQLSAISANMGCISGGSFNGSQTNYWELSSFVDDNNVNHHEGAFRVGGDKEYMWVIPVDEYGNDITSSTHASVRPASYRIEFQVGSFHVNSTATEMNGDFIIQENQDSVDRIKVTPQGVYLEHRANAESPWVLIAGQNTNGVQSQQLYSEASLIVSNQGIDQRRQEKTDIGTPYISEDSQVYHFDTDVADQNKVDDLSIVPSDSYSLVDEQYGKDYTPAILAVSPFSTVAKSIMGLVSITKEFTAGTFTVDFWCKFLTNEDFTLFDLSTPAESVVIKTKKGECFLYEKAETEECPMFAEQDMPVYAMWEPVPVVKCPMYHTADGEECQMMKKDDTVSRMYRATDTQFFQSVDYAQKIDGEYTKVVPTTLTYDSFAEGGLYVETCNYNTPDGECTTLEYEGSSFERRVISWSDEDKDEGLLPHKFNSGDWIHCAVVFSEGRVKVFLGVTDGTVASVSFIRNSETALLTSLVLNSQKKSMLFDELLVDTTTAESLEVFTCNTVQRRPWGALPYSDERNYFILEAENTDLIKTNIGKSSELRADLSDFMLPVGAVFRSTVDEAPHFTGSWVLLYTETLGGKTIYNYERIS